MLFTYPEWVIPENTNLSQLRLELAEAIAYYSDPEQPRRFLCPYCKGYGLHTLGSVIAASLLTSYSLEDNIVNLLYMAGANYVYSFDFVPLRLEWLKQLESKI